MPKVALYNMSGQQVGDIELNEEIFGAEVNPQAMHQVVVNLLANRRQGTQSTKTRAEVRGGGKKPWRQKKTGRARHSSTRSPLWPGGGVTFAPKPRSYRYTVPKKIRRIAIASALSSKVVDSSMYVLDELKFDAPKTKDMVKVLEGLKLERKTLLVLADNEENTIKSARNIEGVAVTQYNTLNVYDILKYDNFLITKEAVQKVEEVFANA